MFELEQDHPGDQGRAQSAGRSWERRAGYRKMIARGTSRHVAVVEQADMFDLDVDHVTPKTALGALYPDMAAVSAAVGTNGLRYVGTFNGSGGSSTGFALAGWRCLASVEFVKAARESLVMNFPSATVEPGDVRAACEEIFADGSAYPDLRVVYRPATVIFGEPVENSVDWERTMDAVREVDTDAAEDSFVRLRYDVSLKVCAQRADAGVQTLWGDDVRGFDPQAFMDAHGIATGQIDALEGSPPCFPAGTMVVCQDGVRPIEQVQVGHKVLTHKGRWRAVVWASSKVAATVLVDDGQVEATADHEFWARATGADGAPVGAPHWVPASSMQGMFSSFFERLPDPGEDAGMEPGWHKVRGAVQRGGAAVVVYDITVDEDASFVANGYIVHNCKSFSLAGMREASWGKIVRYSDERKQRSDDLFVEFVRLLDVFRPKTFIAENVAGIGMGSTESFLVKMIAQMRELGYRVDARVLDAQDYAVPQRRARMFLQGVRLDIADAATGAPLSPTWPTPLEQRYTLGEALEAAGPSTVAEVTGAWLGSKAQLRAAIGSEPAPPAAPWKRIREADGSPTPWEKVPEDVCRYEVGDIWNALKVGGSPDNKAFQMVRAHPSWPSPTITQTSAGNVPAAGICHPHENRKFTTNELRWLFSYPHDYAFAPGTTVEQQGERMGRSVPPQMMRVLAQQMAGVLHRAGLGTPVPAATTTPPPAPPRAPTPTVIS